MNRRAVITAAAAISVTVLAGGSAIAANVGILGNGDRGPVGELSPIAVRTDPSAPATGTGATVETVYVDGTAPGTAATGTTPTSAGAAGTTPGTRYDDDFDDIFEDRDDHDDRRGEDDDHRGEDRDDDEHAEDHDDD
jgi:hypothetical protein